MISYVKNRIPREYKNRIKIIFCNLVDSVKYRCLKKNFRNPQKVKHVVFICTGNICRSAFAEFALKSMVKDRDLVVESCGINVQIFVKSPIEAIEAASRLNVELSSHISKSLASCDLVNADMLVAMDYSHYKHILKQYPEYAHKLVMMRSYALLAKNFFCNIPDPLNMDRYEYDKCYKLIVLCLKNFIKIYFQND